MERNRNSTRAALGATLLVTAALVVAPSLSSEPDSIARAQDYGGEYANAFARADGIAGESDDLDHDNWIEIRTIDWSGHRPRSRAGALRRRAAGVMNDLALTFEYDKATPKLQEKCLTGAVIPKLEIEQVATYELGRKTYLRHELTNVIVTRYELSSDGEGGPPLAGIRVSFEEVRVTYTEYDVNGGKKGDIQYVYSAD